MELPEKYKRAAHRLAVWNELKRHLLAAGMGIGGPRKDLVANLPGRENWVVSDSVLYEVLAEVEQACQRDVSLMSKYKVVCRDPDALK